LTANEIFSVGVLLVAAALIIAVFTNRLSDWIRVPTPALFLIAGAAIANLVPVFGSAPRLFDERIVTIALILILFDGGMHIGWGRFRVAGGAIAWLGIAGTAVTAAAVAVASHYLFGFGWQMALLLGAALSPTDPAVVFSVLGKRAILGRTGTILEGESGANDPVSIALMASLLGATGSGFGVISSGLGEFALQMSVGAAVGIVGGFGLSFLMRKASLPNDALYSIQAIAGALFVYAAATLLHGSGFLAVFILGIFVGDVRAPYKREVQKFSSGLASVAEIVAFAVLGLSIRFEDLAKPGVILIGLALAALLIFVIRPVLVGLVSLPLRLRRGERAFILWAGLKGAVPILLGMFILSAGVPRAHEIYAIIFVVVLVSVLLQGGLVPVFIRLFAIPTRLESPRPWGIDIRFARPPEGLSRHVVESASPAEGSSIETLTAQRQGWVTIVSRDGVMIRVEPTTVLKVGDVVVVQSGAQQRARELFAAPRTPGDS
jgi:cell volume regulation protein A